jgi:hypothetical protein
MKGSSHPVTFCELLANIRKQYSWSLRICTCEIYLGPRLLYTVQLQGTYRPGTALGCSLLIPGAPVTVEPWPPSPAPWSPWLT